MNKQKACLINWKHDGLKQLNNNSFKNTILGPFEIHFIFVLFFYQIKFFNFSEFFWMVSLMSH